MVELFPRAKHVRWSNGEPVVDRSERKYYEDRPAAGFQGFLHPEELVAMAKHANLSERVSVDSLRDVIDLLLTHSSHHSPTRALAVSTSPSSLC